MNGRKRISKLVHGFTGAVIEGDAVTALLKRAQVDVERAVLRGVVGPYRVVTEHVDAADDGVGPEGGPDADDRRG